MNQVGVFFSCAAIVLGFEEEAGSSSSSSSSLTPFCCFPLLLFLSGRTLNTFPIPFGGQGLLAVLLLLLLTDTASCSKRLHMHCSTHHINSSKSLFFTIHVVQLEAPKNFLVWCGSWQRFITISVTFMVFLSLCGKIAKTKEEKERQREREKERRERERKRERERRERERQERICAKKREDGCGEGGGEEEDGKMEAVIKQTFFSLSLSLFCCFSSWEPPEGNERCSTGDGGRILMRIVTGEGRRQNARCKFLRKATSLCNFSKKKVESLLVAFEGWLSYYGRSFRTKRHFFHIYISKVPFGLEGCSTS